MAQESARQNHDPQEMRGLEGDIKHSQEQLNIQDRPPKNLLDWLVRVNSRLLALEKEEQNQND